jgi:hypothetical protein
LGTYVALVVSRNRSTIAPSSRIHRFTVCRPDEGISMLAGVPDAVLFVQDHFLLT